jgi:hypothetical protein
MADKIYRALTDKNEAAKSLIEACLDLEIERDIDDQMRAETAAFPKIIKKLQQIPDMTPRRPTTIVVRPVHFVPATARRHR